MNYRMTRSLSADVWTGLLFCTAGVGFALAASRYPIGTPAQMEAGFFPLILSGLLAAFGLVLLVKGLSPDALSVQSIAWRPALIVLTALVLFGVLLERAGLIVSMLALLAVASRATTGFAPRALVATILALTAGVATLFVGLLGIGIPLLPRI